MFLFGKKKVGGLVKYYKLDDWWTTCFNENERFYIRSKYKPLGHEGSLDLGEITSSSLSVISFLSSLETWFDSKDNEQLKSKIHNKIVELAKEYSNKLGNITYKRGSSRGLIGYFDLDEWWMNTFSDLERKLITSKYQPLGYQKNCLTEGMYEPPISIVAFLYNLHMKFRTFLSVSVNGIDLSRKIEKKYLELVNKFGDDRPGNVNGRHYSSYPNDVIDLERQGKESEAIDILYKLVSATETEYQFMHDIDASGVAPWYYERLAIIYRKKKAYEKEVEILERYAEQQQAPGVKPAKLIERLERAKILLEKSKAQRAI